jgi:hypothetical protein
VIPNVWYNVGQPKEDVYVNNVTIETPEVNETADISQGSGAAGGSSPWIIGLIIFAAVIAALVYFKRQ